MATQKDLQKQAIKQLAIIGGALTKDSDMRFEGTSYVFPQRFENDLNGLAEDVIRYVQSMGEMVTVTETFDYRPFDGAIAARELLKQFFGYAQSKARNTPWGKEPPQEITIPLGFVDGELVKETCPWGDMVLPGLPGATLTLTTDFDAKKGTLFAMRATVRKIDKKVIDGFFSQVRDYLALHSIYRGKAFDGGMNFIDTEKIRPEDFIYSEQIWAEAGTNFLSPLRDREVLKAEGLNPKRVTLLEGPYGTGKTGLLRTAMKTAVAHGHTAIMCRPGEDNPMEVLQTAILYAGDVGVLVCIEDIDVYTRTQDPQILTKLLDVFDGATNKGLPITVVMTTNHAEEITKGMMRSGRIDAVMHIGEMDRPGVEKLGHLVLRHHVGDDIDWDKVFEHSDGFMPAYMREAFERSLRYTIQRTRAAGTVNTDDIVYALDSLRAQYDLQSKANDRMRELPLFDAVFRQSIHEAIDEFNIPGAVDDVVESRVNGAAVVLQDDGGNEYKGNVHTN